MLRTLSNEQYVEHRGGRGRAGYTYRPTVRLLALAAQLAPRLPLVEHGRRVTRELHDTSGMTAYLAIPSYGDVLVIARAGERSPQLWALLPAAGDAAGQLLLAHRDAWRHSLESTHRAASDGATSALIRKRGYASITHDAARAGSLATPVPAQDGPPLAALGVQGPCGALTAGATSLVELLQDAAARLAGRVSAPGPPNQPDQG